MTVRSSHSTYGCGRQRKARVQALEDVELARHVVRARRHRTEWRSAQHRLPRRRSAADRSGWTAPPETAPPPVRQSPRHGRARTPPRAPRRSVRRRGPEWCPASLTMNRTQAARGASERPAPNCAQDLSRDDHAVHFVRTVVDARRARFAVPALQRRILAEAERAVHLDGAVQHVVQHARADELDHRDLGARVGAAVHQPRRVQRHQPEAVDLGRRIRDPVLDRLQVRQPLAARFTLAARAPASARTRAGPRRSSACSA